MLNLMERTLDSLLSLEEDLLQEKIERTKERLQKNQGVRKVVEKTQVFYTKKEKQIFEEERKEFGIDQGSSSNT
jgi:hypothetical protein